MSNLPVENKPSFLGRIASFFKRLFGIELEDEVFDVSTEEKEETTEAAAVEAKVEEKQSFEDSIKTEVSNDFLKDEDREEYLKTFEKNPALLFGLPMEKLKVIDNYYDSLIAKEKEKLARLTKGTNNA